MNGYERQWFVVVCVTLLTLFTVNSLPFQNQYNGFGIKDDPAESQALSLTEREASNDKAKSESQGNLDDFRDRRSTAKNLTDQGQVNNTAVNSSALNSTTNIAVGGKIKVTASASPENVAIVATRTGDTLISTSINHVNITVTPSYSIQNDPKKSSVVNMATYTSSIKTSSLPKIPTVKSLQLSQIRSASLNLKPSMSVTTTVKASDTLALPANLLPTTPSASNTSSVPSTQNVSSNTSAISTPSTQNLTTPSTQNQTTQSSSNPPSTKSGSIAPSTEKPTTVLSNQSSSIPPYGILSTGKPSTGKPSTGKPSTVPSTNKPSTEKPSTVPSTGEPSTVPSTNKPSTEKPSTVPSSSKPSTVPSTGKPSTNKPSTEKPSTVPPNDEPSTVPSTNKPSTNKPSTVEQTAIPSTGPASLPTTTKVKISEKVTTKITTQRSTIKPTTQGKSTQAKTNKEVKTESKPTKKTTPQEAEPKNENNDEGQMPPPNQGKEAVLWDFIVPVAIGTGVALSIAFGVVVVRACRRRKLVKVRFGGKPSHPRLLNNDLINLLAESDDEEE